MDGPLIKGNCKCLLNLLRHGFQTCNSSYFYTDTCAYFIFHFALIMLLCTFASLAAFGFGGVFFPFVSTVFVSSSQADRKYHTHIRKHSSENLNLSFFLFSSTWDNSWWNLFVIHFYSTNRERYTKILHL